MEERTIQSRRAFDGQLVKLDVVDVELPNGHRSTREILRHPGAAVILAEHRDGRFLLVRQYRKAAEAALLEVVAGTRHDGEPPEDCARRELFEETGFEAQTLSPLGTVYPAPGYTDECLHVYHALVSGERQDHEGDEDEILELVTMTRPELEREIGSGRIHDAKTLAAWALYTNRDVTAGAGHE